MLKRNVNLKAQIVKVRKEHSEKFMEAYHRATGVFNNFYGPLLMTANNAFNEAFDLYEGTPKFRFQVKKAFKNAAKEYDKFWACVRFIFDDRYSVYVDYCATAVEQVWQDVMKLYWVVRGSLLKQDKPDTERLAWVFTSHLLITEAKKLHAKWCISIAEQSGYPTCRSASSGHAQTGWRASPMTSRTPCATSAPWSSPRTCCLRSKS